MGLLPIIFISISLLLAGCSGGADLGGLQIEDGKGRTFGWSLPDENCIQTGFFTNPSGVKIKRQQIAKDCIPKTKE